MKWLLAVVWSLGVTANGATLVGNWNIYITPVGGGERTGIKIFLIGTANMPFIGSNVAGLGIGISGYGLSPAGAWSMADIGFTIQPIGNINNITTGVERPLNHITFRTRNTPEYAGVKDFILGWGWQEGFVDGLNINPGDDVVFNVSQPSAQFEIELPFSSFNPGTYNNTVGDAQFNMEIVPEPSSFSLLLAGGAVLITGRRRKSD